MMRILKRVLTGLLVIALALVAVVLFLAFSLRATIPAAAFDPQPGTGAEQRGPVLIFGATRNTGLEVARILSQRGQSVTAAVRTSSDRTQLYALGVDIVVADALDPQAVRAAANAREFVAVITTVGCMRCEPPPDYLGNRNIVDAAVAAGIPRLILVTSVGAGDSYDAANLLTRIVLRDVLPLKTRAEDHLRASGLDYTIIRPGGLRSNETLPTGAGTLSEDRSALGFIHRADLAQLIVATLDDPRAGDKTFAAFDKTIEKPWE